MAYQEKLFPVKYNGKYYKKEECNNTFIAYYHTRHALNNDGGVYIADSMWIYPDGTINEY